ncbi:MAG: nucleotidyltransferase domain-containing protein [Firmicutes bacterium]|nr:nucleotidyltransferase domain-containing protein [Bacillota bacterium]
MMRREVLQKQLPTLLDYFASNDTILTVYLFGSIGTNRYIPSLSDLDLAIIFSKDRSLMEEMKIGADISILLEREDIDLINLNKARVDLCHEIISTGEIIYEKERVKTADFVERTLQHYFDYGIPLKRIREEFLETLKGEAADDG